VEAAHAAGLRVTAHAHSLAGARDAVLAGFDCIEHGYRLDAATIAEMAGRGTWLVPTLVAMEASQAPMLAPGRPEADAARARERWEAAADAARQAHRAGVRLATGTDAPSIVPVDAIRREVALLVDAAGLTPVEALRAATSAAADLLGIPGRAGVIAPGAAASFLLVDGDPLADPACLARVHGVWQRGRRVRPAVTT
jgi:imidazolonepropionase-like amidohydrolase